MSLQELKEQKNCKLSVSDHLALINAIISVASSASIACPTTVLGTKEDDGGETKKVKCFVKHLTCTRCSCYQFGDLPPVTFAVICRGVFVRLSVGCDRPY